MLNVLLDFFSNPSNVQRVSTRLLLTGLVMLLAGAFAAYGFEGRLSIVQLVVAHAGVIVGPTLLKIGYVMRLAAHYNRCKTTEAHCTVA